MSQNKVASTVTSMAEPVITEMGYELVDLNYEKEGGNWFLRLFIDKTGGITHDDCSLVSEKVGDLLDHADIVPHQYYLEVSSPGMFRPLKKKEHYDRFRGEQVEISAYAPIDGKKKWIGELTGLDGDEVLLKVDGEGLRIPLSAVAKARLHPDF